ncbi:MAG: hypothetical protein AAGD38_17115 [Acidobacteriota bacterium]
MRFFFMLTALMLVAVSAQAGGDVEIDRIDRSFELTSQQELEITVDVGEVRIDGVSGDRVELEVRVFCERRDRRCEREAEKLRVEIDDRGSLVQVKVRRRAHDNDGDIKLGDDAPDVEVYARVPRNHELEVEMGVGDLEVAGMENDQRVELGVGAAVIRIDEDTVATVDVEVGVGDADLSPRPRGTDSSGFFFLGNEVSWTRGPGDAHVEVEVGVGEGEVVLVD